MLSFIVWIAVGLLAGLLARALMPGRQSMGLLLTTLLGLAGSLLGGFIGTLVWQRNAGQLSAGGLVLSVAGAVMLLFLYTLIRRPAHA